MVRTVHTPDGHDCVWVGCKGDLGFPVKWYRITLREFLGAYTPEDIQNLDAKAANTLYQSLMHFDRGFAYVVSYKTQTYVVRTALDARDWAYRQKFIQGDS